MTARKRLLLVVAALVLLAGGPPAAAKPSCSTQLLDGEPPALVNPRLAADTRELCYTGYATLYSGLTRTPLWSAEHLTRERVAATKGLTRHNAFHADPSLPPGERAELSDYARSGFDRGHMAPSDDMPDERSQEESFSLANMVPQNPDNNRGLWRNIEAAVRRLAQRDGEVYVVTGPLFQGETLQRLNGRVLVPTGLFKAVYDPKRRAAGAYVVPNEEGQDWRAVSIAELERESGIDVFPALPPLVKETAMGLPDPTAHRRLSRRHAERP